MSFYINIYKTANGQHYSRPHLTLESAIEGRAWFDGYLRQKAVDPIPYQFLHSIRVKVKDPALLKHLNGGPTLFSEPGRKGRPKAKKASPAPIVPPEGYVNATALNQPGSRTWPNFWRAKAVKAQASVIAADLDIPLSDLVVTRTGGNVEHQGTWTHPRIAEHFRAWLDAGERRAA